MGQEVREYNTPGTISGITVPPNTVSIEVYIVGAGANGLAGNGSVGGAGGGGGAFGQFNVASTPSSTYSVTIPAGGSGSQTMFGHLRDNQMTTGQSSAWAGSASGQAGAPASSCGNSGYGGGTLSNVHKGGTGALKGANGDDGGGGGGGGRVVADGGDGMGNQGSGLGGAGGGTGMSQNGQHGADVSTGASSNTGGGGGGGWATGQGGGGSAGKVRVTITTNP